MTTRVVTEIVRDVYSAVWASLAKGESGDAFRAPHFNDKTVIVEGTFDTVTVTIQGRNDSGAWVTLHDPQGSDLTFTTDGTAIISENTEEVRPTVDSSGTGTTDVKVSIIAKTSK